MKKIFILILYVNVLVAGEIYIIANSNISTSKKELQKFFAAKSDYLDGDKYKRINNEASVDTLAELVFSISAKKLSKKWIKQNFRRGTPFPLTLKSDEKTIEWVKNHLNSIGFVTQKPLDVNVIYTFKE